MSNRVETISVGVWNIKVEGASKRALPFLDVLFRIGDVGTLAFEPWAKPTKLFMPLHEESAHHPRCHSWHVVEVHRLALVQFV